MASAPEEPQTVPHKAHDTRQVLSWSGIEAGLLILYGIISTPLVALWLGPENLGKAGVVLAIITLIEIVCSLGLQEALIRCPSIHTRLTDSAHTALVALGLLGMGLVCAIAYPVARLYGDPDVATLLILASPILPITASTLVPISVLTRKFRARALSLRNMAARTINLVLTVGLAVAGYGATSVVVSALCGAIASFILVNMTLNRRSRFRFNWQELKPLVRYGLSISAENLITSGSVRVFALLLGYLHGLSALGLFQLAQRLVDEVAQIFQMMIMRYGLAYFSSFTRRGLDPTDVLLKATRILAFISLPVFGGLTICAHDLVLTIFGPKWLPSVPILQFCAIAWMLAFPVLLVPPLLRAQGQQNTLVGYAAFSATVAILALLFTQSLPQWTVGASWAARHVPAIVCALAALALYCAISPRRMLQELLRPALAVAVMITATLAFVEVSQLQHTPRLLVSIVVGVLTYAAAVWFVDREFFRTLVTWFRGEPVQLDKTFPQPSEDPSTA